MGNASKLGISLGLGIFCVVKVFARGKSKKWQGSPLAILADFQGVQKEPDLDPNPITISVLPRRFWVWPGAVGGLRKMAVKIADINGESFQIRNHFGLGHFLEKKS